MNSRLSYIPVPVAHVLRDGKRFLVDAKDIIVSDIVFLDAKVSGIIPADLILVAVSDSEDFLISNYTDTFDPGNKHLAEYRQGTVPETAYKKSAKLWVEGEPENLDEMPEFILDSPNFVPMGARLFSGQGQGICVRIGNETIKALMR